MLAATYTRQDHVRRLLLPLGLLQVDGHAWLEGCEATDGQSTTSCCPLDELRSTLCRHFHNEAQELLVRPRLRRVAMVWLDDVSQNTNVRPLFIGKLGSAHKEFYFLPCLEGAQALNGQDRVETLLERLYLQVDGLVEHCMKHKVDVFLEVIERDRSLFSISDQLNGVVHWIVEVIAEILQLSSHL